MSMLKQISDMFVLEDVQRALLGCSKITTIVSKSFDNHATIGNNIEATT